MCDICGVQWYMSDLRRGEDGLLHCPDEGDGMDLVECAQDFAESTPGSDFIGGFEPSNVKGTVDI